MPHTRARIPLTPKAHGRKHQTTEELEQRITDFSVGVIRMVASFPHGTAPDVLGRELLHSATLIAPAYRDANRAEDGPEFTTKVAIAFKEAVETQYWLELLIRSEILGASAATELQHELTELLPILKALGKRLEKR